MTFRGLIVPMPTLFGPDGALDPGRNGRFAAGLAASGADHVFALGSLGEFPLLTEAERASMLAAVIAAVGGSADVWVGTGAPSTVEAVRSSRAAEAAGAAALLVVPPFYLHPSLEQVDRYYRAIREAVKLPLYAYNIPSLVGYALPAPFVHSLVRDGILLGTKDTSESLASIEAFLAGAPPGFELFPGDDALASPSIDRGASGAVMGLANVLPRLCAALVRAAHSKDAEAAGELQLLVDALGFAAAGGSFPSNDKFLAQHLRHSEVGYRSPYDALTPAEEARILARLAPWLERLAPYR